MTLDFNIDWATYWNLFAVIVLWVLGFFITTRENNLLYPINALLNKKKSTVERHSFEIENELYQKLKTELVFNESSSYCKLNIILDTRKAIVKCTMEELISFVKSDQPVHFFYNKPVNILPDYITKPIVNCVTCMPSVHGFLIYTIYSVSQNLAWNPLQWLVLAMPATFVTTLVQLIYNLIFKMNQDEKKQGN